MAPANIDISVLLIFFARPEPFAKVFEQVRKARPSRLFLYQDGPREGNATDAENIRKCREIAENIDWECEVHKLYQEKNIGVDPSGYLADKWAFSLTDKCIVLEDDVVPSLCFFDFCKKMLDKYENDERVMLISGINEEEITEDVDTDYFFSATTFTWGWASWARVVNNWDPTYQCIKNKDSQKKIRKFILNHGLLIKMPWVFKRHLDSGIEHWETLLISNQYLHEGLTIVPKKNMINNIGLTNNSAHYVNSIDKLPKGVRRIFTMKRYEMDTSNLQEPEKIEDYRPYTTRTYRINAWGHPFIKVYRKIEQLVYKIVCQQ